MNIPDRAERWAARFVEAHRTVDDAKLAHAIGTDYRRCYLCRRTEQDLGLSGMPPGFWLCQGCKDMPPSAGMLRKATK